MRMDPRVRTQRRLAIRTRSNPIHMLLMPHPTQLLRQRRTSTISDNHPPRLDPQLRPIITPNRRHHNTTQPTIHHHRIPNQSPIQRTNTRLPTRMRRQQPIQLHTPHRRPHRRKTTHRPRIRPRTLHRPTKTMQHQPPIAMTPNPHSIRNTQRLQLMHRPRRQTIPTGLIPRKHRLIHQQHLKPPTRRMKRSSRPRRPSPHHQHIHPRHLRRKRRRDVIIKTKTKGRNHEPHCAHNTPKQQHPHPNTTNQPPRVHPTHLIGYGYGLVTNHPAAHPTREAPPDKQTQPRGLHTT